MNNNFLEKEFSQKGYRIFQNYFKGIALITPALFGLGFYIEAAGYWFSFFPDLLIVFGLSLLVCQNLSKSRLQQPQRVKIVMASGWLFCLSQILSISSNGIEFFEAPKEEIKKILTMFPQEEEKGRDQNGRDNE